MMIRSTGKLASACYRALQQSSINPSSSTSRTSINLISKRSLYRWSTGNPAAVLPTTTTSLLPSLNQSACRQFVRNFASDKKKEEVSPEDKIKQLKEQIGELEKAVAELKGCPKAAGREIAVAEGKYDKQPDDEDEVIYRLAYDFPGFKLKNIRVSVFDKILKVYAFQTSSKKDKDTKEYIYENTTEEILPNEVDVNKLKATFDSENGFLIVEAILPEESNLKEIQARAKELNDKLFKLDKELEAKKKELTSIKV